MQIPIVLFVGLIGSGKSTVLKVLSERGAATILMDDLWKTVVYQECYCGSLSKILGQDVLSADGLPDLAKLRALFFSLDPIEQVNCIARISSLKAEFRGIFSQALHLEIIRRSQESVVSMIVIEGALALQEGWDKKLSPDHVVALHCPKEVRLERIQKRNPVISKATYQAIMNMQPTDSEHLKASNASAAIQFFSDISMENLVQNAGSLYERLIK